MTKKEGISELKKIIGMEPEPEKTIVKIIFDGKQNNIRIPKTFVQAVSLDPAKDKFEFILKRPSSKDYEKSPELTGKLIKG
jgi:hypothetical protein